MMLKSLRSNRQIKQGEGDDALVLAFANGDMAAAQKLTTKLTPTLFAVAYRMVADSAEAEDIVQETMLRLWKAAPEWEVGKAQVSTWAYRVASNLAIDKIRKRKANVEFSEEHDPGDPNANVETALQNQSRRTALYEAIAKLPPRQAQATTLRHIEGLSNPEIAEMMSIGVEAVESLIGRGKRGLIEILGKRKRELGYDT